MSKAKLTKKQTLALLVTNYQELKTLFSSMPKLKIKDSKERMQQISDDLHYLITEGFNHNIEDTAIYSIFNAESDR